MPAPQQGESRQEFIERCMASEEARRDFPDNDQRLAFCMSQLETNMDQIQANIRAEPRLSTFQSQTHLVVPVVMARANVDMNGASIPEAELIPQSWNGVPVTVGHPQENNQFVSANAPDTLEQWEVGRIFNAFVEDGDLKGEAWINTNRAEELRPGLIESLQNQEARMDVSTGYFSRHTNNQHVDIKPDHLALLPDTNGACSWEDGCGVRANEKGSGIMPKLNEAWQTVHNALFGLQGNCECDTEAKLNETFGAHWNELSYGQTMDQIQRKLDAMDSAMAIHFLTDVYDSSFIYHVRPGSQAPSGEPVRSYRRSYTVDESDNVTFGDDVVEVRKVVTYEPITGTGNETEDGDMPTDTNEDKPDVQSDDASGGGGGGGPLSAEDKRALELARNQAAKYRGELVEKITSNTDMTEDQLQNFGVEHLETIANGIRPKADYGGRAVPAINSEESESGEDEAVQAMTANSAAAYFTGDKEK